jgi:hypothetical protein
LPIRSSKPSSSTSNAAEATDLDRKTSTSTTEELEVHAIANLGDSISQAFDADDAKPIDIGTAIDDPNYRFRDNSTLSWIQGSDPRIGSVAEHYRKRDANLVVTPLSCETLWTLTAFNGGDGTPRPSTAERECQEERNFCRSHGRVGALRAM